MFENWKQNVIALIVSICIVAIVCLALFRISVPRYTNMSDQQSFSQTNQWFNAEVHACENQGGSWLVSVATADCSIAYVHPDTSWYKEPIDNPFYGYWEWIQSILLCITYISALFALMTIMRILYDSKIIYEDVCSHIIAETNAQVTSNE